MLINRVFENIAIKGLIDKHIILFWTFVWIKFYKLDLVLITLPLPKLIKVAENCQKQLALIGRKGIHVI